MKNYKELERVYAEWRVLTEDLGGSVDCGEARVREDFTEYAELDEEISFEDMLVLENNY